jgi:hypothetical protein
MYGGGNMNIYAIETFTLERVAAYRREADTARLLGTRTTATPWFGGRFTRRMPKTGTESTMTGVAGCCA